MRRITPSLVLSVVAIVLACTAVAPAASSLITGRQVKDSSLTGRDIKNRSLSPADFSGSVAGPRGFTGLAGAMGPAGPAGPKGDAGPAGPAGTAGLSNITTVDGASIEIPPGGADSPPNAQCPSGSTVVGTGFYGPFGGVGGFVKKYGTFVGGFFVNATSITLDASVQAICAAVPPGGSLFSLRPQRGAFQEDVRAAREELR